jgi:hypothetical protein
MKPETTPCAEVITSSLTSYNAHCWQWDSAPPFSSLVCTQRDNLTLFGLVTMIETGSTDPQRVPFPYKKTEEELRAQHPQIFQFLRTTITVSVLGFQEHSGSIIYATPPQPAKIHSFITPATSAQKEAFFGSADFLPLLASATESSGQTDELILSLIHMLLHEKVMAPRLFESYYQTLALVVGNDYRRLKLLLGRLKREGHALIEE